jgi:ArsR family transcriptional regulator, arsenate/arsenite/antimonite-responsive transcriptional repressor
MATGSGGWVVVIFGLANIWVRDIFVNANMSSPCCSAKPAPKVKDLDALTDVYAALADPTRLRILALLRDGEICVCHLHASLDVPQPTASRHLAYLRKSGLVDARRDGTWMHYRLTPIGNPVVAAVVDAALHALSHTAVSVSDERRLHVARKAS